MTALFLLGLIGLISIAAGRTMELRRLRIPTVALLSGGTIFLAGIGFSQRYLHDLYPFLVVASAAGVCRITTAPSARIDAAAMLVLTVIGVTLNCAFALEFQREIVWGVPKAKQEQWARIRSQIDQFCGQTSGHLPIGSSPDD